MGGFITIQLESLLFTPVAEGHGLCLWMNAPAFGRDVAPLGREVGCHGLCLWGSTFWEGLKKEMMFSDKRMVAPR